MIRLAKLVLKIRRITDHTMNTCISRISNHSRWLWTDSLLKVKCDHRSKFSNLSNWKEEAWKNSGLQRDSNPWPLRYWCDALPTELWSHTLGARSIYWVHIFPCSEIILRWSHFTFIYNCSTNINCFILYFTRFIIVGIYLSWRIIYLSYVCLTQHTHCTCVYIN